MGKNYLFYEFVPNAVVDSNLFWLTEYIKRNSRRQEWFVVRGEEIEKEYGMEVGEANFDMSVFYDENYMPSFSPNRRKNAESIIRNMSSGTFVPKCDPFCFDTELLSPVQMVIEDGKTPRFEFDIDGDSVTISKHVQLLLDYYRGIKKPVARGSFAMSSLDGVEDEQQEDRYMLRSLPTIKADLRLGLKARQAGDCARAIGLWLWDYGQKNSEDRKEGTVAAAIRAMKIHLGPEVEALGFAASEENVFRRFYRKTAECIDACEVLPFK